ncbi:lactonase family protein [Subtercola sp. RTI3]|uniref:lactonase family protein n=1 Tax=Subtercola sp. RTI3 TaxID=3048639 RepID=UPI002B223F12|nr:beta-propeller fold lactonase family protein [Subtercola sp. RTI3]MEA9986158.1 beta-propeller fold lactonase family protein [Subtercola sp. RTI3]
MTTADAASVSTALWVGSYTADAGRDGVGVGALTVASDGQLAWAGVGAAASSPSFVAVHPELPVVYAVAEAAETVAAYRQPNAASPTLEPFGEPWPAGAAVCHVAVAPDARYLTVTCWGDGRVLLYELGADGSIGSRFEGAPAADPHAATTRAASAALAEAGLPQTLPPRVSRAHASLMLPDGRIMTTDLGFDLLRVWNYVPVTTPETGVARGLVLDHEVELPFGSGPRHMALHPNGSVLVVTEYSIEVVVVRVGAAATSGGRYGIASVGPATNGGARAGDSAAEIALSGDARFAYVGVRGSNLVSTLRIDEAGAVHPVADTDSGGDWPRHHAVLGRLLLVAHERSSEVTAFELDPETGVPSRPIGSLAVAAPTALVPAR